MALSTWKRRPVPISAAILNLNCHGRAGVFPCWKRQSSKLPFSICSYTRQPYSGHAPSRSTMFGCRIQLRTSTYVKVIYPGCQLPFADFASVEDIEFCIKNLTSLRVQKQRNVRNRCLAMPSMSLLYVFATGLVPSFKTMKLPTAMTRNRDEGTTLRN